MKVFALVTEWTKQKILEAFANDTYFAVITKFQELYVIAMNLSQ